MAVLRGTAVGWYPEDDGGLMGLEGAAAYWVSDRARDGARDVIRESSGCVVDPYGELYWSAYISDDAYWSPGGAI